jgi:hypothetical protein
LGALRFQFLPMPIFVLKIRPFEVYLFIYLFVWSSTEVESLFGLFYQLITNLWINSILSRLLFWVVISQILKNFHLIWSSMNLNTSVGWLLPFDPGNWLGLGINNLSAGYYFFWNPIDTYLPSIEFWIIKTKVTCARSDNPIRASNIVEQGS